jgi:hypothetical protein
VVETVKTAPGARNMALDILALIRPRASTAADGTNP